MELIAGVDEAGRGPLVGSVVAAAVILPEDFDKNLVDDSKKLSEKKREALAKLIKREAVAYGIASASHQEIDELNILQASLLAMQRAVEALSVKPTLVYVDGIHSPNIDIPCKALPKADSLIAEVSAASILAKVTRDAEMIALDAEYPAYGFAKHKGYPTKAHLALLREHGVLQMYRKSYRPVQQLLR